jgi:hypothetical protein
LLSEYLLQGSFAKIAWRDNVQFMRDLLLLAIHLLLTVAKPLHPDGMRTVAAESKLLCYRRFKFDHLAGCANLLLTTAAIRQTLVNAQSARWSVWGRWEHRCSRSAE